MLAGAKNGFNAYFCKSAGAHTATAAGETQTKGGAFAQRGNGEGTINRAASRFTTAHAVIG